MESSLTSILIEICAHCNRRCRWCPNHDHARERGFLEYDLITKVLDEAAKVKTLRKITFNLYNEPLLDERLDTIIFETRRKIPKVQIYLNTNGDLLDLNRWADLREAGLDWALVSQYDGKQTKNIALMRKYLSGVEKEAMRVNVFDVAKSANNRGGAVELETQEETPVQRMCDRPMYQLCINHLGKAILCCNDFFGEVEMGDIRKQTVEELWANPEFEKYRQELFKGNRAVLPLCRSCTA